MLADLGDGGHDVENFAVNVAKTFSNACTQLGKQKTHENLPFLFQKPSQTL